MLADWLWAGFLVFSSLVGLVFTAAYGFKARWWRTFLGINLFMEAVAVTAFFTLAAIDSLFGLAWEWAARSVLVIVSVVMVQRLAILYWVRRGHGPLLGYLMGRRRHVGAGLRAGGPRSGAPVDAPGGAGGAGTPDPGGGDRSGDR